MKKLLYAESLGYAQMRPVGVESNHFAYHLEQLVRTDIVTKKDRKYSLAPEGLILVDRMSQEKMVDRVQPHIVTAIDITTGGRTLLFKRAFQPYIHCLGFPLGKIHFEETILEAAQRELQEKTSLTGISLSHRGVVYLESKIQGVVISKVMYHLFQGTIGEPQPTSSSRRGSCVWADDSTMQSHELMPGFRSMKALLQSEPNFFFAEVSDELRENESR